MESAPPSRSTLMLWTVGLLLVVTAGRLPLLGTADPNFLYYSTVITGFVWLLGFIVFLGAFPDESPSPYHLPQGGEGVGIPAAVRGAEVSVAVAVGLFAFLLHDTINFAMFVPGSATTFFALLGFWFSERGSRWPQFWRRRPWWSRSASFP
jgi:hypothetical protein